MDEHDDAVTRRKLESALAEMEGPLTPEVVEAQREFGRRMREGIQRGDPEWAPRVGRWVEVLDVAPKP